VGRNSTKDPTLDITNLFTINPNIITVIMKQRHIKPVNLISGDSPIGKLVPGNTGNKIIFRRLWNSKVK